MGISLDEMREIAKRNADESFRDGHIELAKNAVDVWVDTALEILDLESLIDRADTEEGYPNEGRTNEGGKDGEMEN